MHDSNIVHITGVIQGPPGERITAQGSRIMEATIRVEKKKKTDGETGIIDNFFRLNIFGILADRMRGRLVAGVKVTLTGELHSLHHQEDNRGAVVVNVKSIQLLQDG